MGNASARLDDFKGKLAPLFAPAPKVRFKDIIAETVPAPVAHQARLSLVSGSMHRADILADFARCKWSEEIDVTLPCYDFGTLMEEIPIRLPPIKPWASDDDWMPHHKRCLMLIDIVLDEGDLQYLALVTRNEGELEITTCGRRGWEPNTDWDLCPWTVAVGRDGIGLVFYSSRYDPNFDYVPAIDLVVESVRMGTEILSRLDIILNETTTPRLRATNALRKEAGLGAIPPTRQVSLA